jgi:L-fuconolactonase
MPNFPIIDTHLHVWDQNRLRYSAFEGHPLFGRPSHVEDYRRDCGALDVEAMVFVECYADFDEDGGQYIEEIELVEEEAKRDPGIRAIVPMAPLEQGTRVLPMLTQMRDRHPSVRGVRRILEFDRDPRSLASGDSFVEGVNLLAEFGWHFEITVNHTQMDIVRALVPRLANVPLILDHCGKPGIREGAIEQYRDDVQALSRCENLWIKLSDLPVEADWEKWTPADLRPYIVATLDTFGPDRTLFGGDYPILLQATTMSEWVEVLDEAFADLRLSESETRKIYRDNAIRFYRLSL